MSRIGKAPVSFGSNVQVNILGNKITVKGAQSTQIIEMNPLITASVKDHLIVFHRKDESKKVAVYMDFTDL